MKIKQITTAFLFMLLFASCGPADKPHTEGGTTGNDTTMQKPDSIAAVSAAPDSSTSQIARTFLQQAFKEDISKGFIDSLSRKFTTYIYDLNGDGAKEIFAGLTGPYFCGSGGCTWFLLDSSGKLINRFTVSQYPVYIAKEKTNNWNNLIVLSGGKNHNLKFSGTNYPSNPSVQPVFNGDTESLQKALDITTEKYPWRKF
ncbi:MAG: hypothetical protein EOP46_00830 [Sphingobacteriaceae bacterium]|nr:MAG: hypothetical protein EOP46_00830 [Sphingobacteriaceae bacterium]